MFVFRRTAARTFREFRPITVTSVPSQSVPVGSSTITMPKSSFEVSQPDYGSSQPKTDANKKKWLTPFLWGLLILLLVAAIVIPIVIVYTTSVDNGDRIACFPLIESDLDSSICESHGCVWDGIAENVKCHLPFDGSKSYGYELNKVPITTPTGIKVDLRRRANTPSLYGGDWENVTFEAIYYTNQMLRFAFYPTDGSMTIQQPPVPLNLPNQPNGTQADYVINLSSYQAGSPFDFKITRKSTNKVLLDTKLGGLTLADQFHMITFTLATTDVYGIGESTHDSFRHNLNYKMWPIFARDQPPGDGELNLYGSHPFYMVSEEDGSSHGVFFYNAHALDYTLLPYPGITYRTIGGGLDFFIFTGPTPESVVQQYTDIIGRTFMPPYWSLGFQLSRYGYTGTDEMREVVNRTRLAGIPQDIQYADIDYMDNQADFTLNMTNFGDLPQFVTESARQGLRFIPILDPAINTEKGDSYQTHINAMANNVYITWANNSLQPNSNCTSSPGNCQPLSNVMLAYVWPDGRTAFPDFFKDSTVNWWHQELLNFHSTISYHGIWIDMNEPAAFDTNQDKPFNWPPGKPDWNLKCPVNKWDDPPYITLSASRSATKRLSDKTICMVGRQGPNDEYLHYAVHNLYGWSESIATYSGVQSATGKRGVVISRSTFPSSGKYTGHWLGDNTSRWKDMHTSIIGMMEFNMFGIPYIGADVCGFFNPTTEQLCQRWMELGAFYPFSRNHNTIGMPSQDPGMWPSVASASKTALNIRYRLLPYLYTLFYHSHTKGSTVIRPLYHEYPMDSEAKKVDTQFLWGGGLLISPVLTENQVKLPAYLPDDVWYDYYTGKLVDTVGHVTLDAPLEKINLHLRGGYIFPGQTEDLNTDASRKNSFRLIVAIGADGKARGDFFWDDGDSQNTISNERYTYLTFSYSNTTVTESVLKMNVGHNSSSIPSELDGLTMDDILICGIAGPKTITVNGIALTTEQQSYDQQTKVATLTKLKLSMMLEWILNFSF